jgi:hypothetical protein
MRQSEALCKCGHRKSDHKRPSRNLLDGVVDRECSGQNARDSSGAVTNEMPPCPCKKFERRMPRLAKERRKA